MYRVLLRYASVICIYTSTFFFKYLKILYVHDGHNKAVTIKVYFILFLYLIKQWNY